MSYKVIWEEKGIWLWHCGTVTSKEIFDSNMEFYSDSRSDESKYQLIDFTDVETIVLSELTAQEIAMLDSVQSRSTKNLKVALIGTSRSAKELFQNYIDHSLNFQTNWLFQIFDDLNSARKWASVNEY